MPNMTTVNGGTIITIPAGKWFFGDIMLAATLNVQPGGAATSSFPSVTVSGVGGTWDNGSTVISLALFTGPVSLSSLQGASTAETAMLPNIRFHARDNDVSFILNHDASTTAAATAIGEIK